MLEKTKGKNVGKVLPFVRGLRFSALLIYAIREYLSGTDLTASWGHILGKDEVYCSRECDIIIHKKGHVHKWNGTKKHIMDFRFIEASKVKAVISCKSLVRASNIDKTYCDDMKKYVKRVWMFAECCSPRDAAVLNEKAKALGFKDCFYMYTWTRKNGTISKNDDGWVDFAKKIKKLSM
ncbi:MAG: hypothetical protein QM724_14155 [Flavobacteriales bacterium]